MKTRVEGLIEVGKQHDRKETAVGRPKVMTFFLLFAFVAFPVCAAAADADTLERLETLEKKLKERDNDMRVYFNNGLKIVSPDKKFQYQIGGRIQTDAVFYASGDASTPENGAEFRRARLFVAGILYRRILFKAQFDFAGQTSFKDVYIGVRGLPVAGNVIAGHFREPFSLEEQISSKHDTFIEDSLMNAFSPARNLGLAFYDSALNGRATWAVGVFRQTGENPPQIQSDDGINLSLRVTGVPWIGEDGRSLLHLGVSYGYSTPSESAFQFDSRPESNLADNFLDTGSVSAENANRFGIEAASVWGSLHVAGEYTFLTVQRPAGLPDADLHGGYVSAGYFLTGELRSYRGGVFRRVVPNRNLFEGGVGAWELALRYSTLDLDDGAVAGGEEDNFTAAVNWYLNPHTRAMFNYVLADIEGAGGVDLNPLHVFQFRFQIDF